MGVSIKVNGDDNSLVHKGSNHFARNTMPDVCKTPSPGGPVPIPYPVIVSLASNLTKGTSTVKAEGNMIAVKGSELSRCTGDEPGTAGGVKSSTNMKEAKWILYSFDVKMEGKNACRLTDKLSMNHENTVCLAGIGGMPCRVSTNTIKQELCKEFCADIAAGKNKSSDLENRLRQDPKWAQSGIHFAMKFLQRVAKATAKAAGRAGQAMGGSGAYVLVKVIPDVVQLVGGAVNQCFDFKFPGDRWRRDQYRRQQRLAGGKKPIEISCKTCNQCGGACP